MSTILDELVSFCLDPSLGCYTLRCPIDAKLSRAYDTYARAVTLTNTPYIRASAGGWGLFNGATGRVDIADGVEQQGTEGTVFVGSGGFGTPAATEYLVSKASVALGTMWSMYTTFSTNKRVYFDAGTARFVNYDTFSDRSLCVTYETGQIPDLYVNGDFNAAFSGSVTVTPNAAPVIIGGDTAATNCQNHGIQLLALFSEQLTQQQISDLHWLFNRLRSRVVEPNLSKARNSRGLSPLVKLSGRVRAAEAEDVSGNELHMALAVGTEVECKTPTGCGGFCAHGGTKHPMHLEVTDTQLVGISSSPITYTFWVNRRGAGEVGAGHITALDTNILIHSDATAGGRLYLFQLWDSGGAFYANWHAPCLAQDAWEFVSVRFDGVAGNLPEVRVNGTDRVVTTLAASAGSVLANAGGALLVLDRVAKDRELDGCIADFQIHASYLTDAEVDRIYHSTAHCVVWDRGYVHKYPEMATNVAVGNVGPFSIVSGQWKNNQDSEVVCGVSGIAARRQDGVYGLHYFTFNKKTRANLILDMLTGTVPAVYTDTQQNGYLFDVSNTNAIFVFRITSGVFASIGVSTGDDVVDSEVTYEVGVAMAPLPSGLNVELWIRGGAYTTWTLLDTAVDATPQLVYGYSTIHRTASDRAGNFLYFPYLYTGPGSVPYLAD